ncbi:MAG: dihydrolipoamide acetyltransferase family protein [Alphaproteobacteria bacterium]|nr:dihydrolipoamide acetyltransferase family protein [Alphaproteobacteria bacterium]
MAEAAPFLMPKLGLTMTEGSVVEWRVAPGQAFSAGETVIVVETEKIANEIAAPADGRIESILVAEGETVPVGTPIAECVFEGKAATVATVVDAPAPTPAPTKAKGGRIRATPLAKRLARERGIDLATIAGSGPGGRIKAADVEAASTAPAPAEAAAAPIGTERLAPSPHQRTVARRLGAVKEGVPHFYLATEAEASELQRLEAQLGAIEGQPRVGLTHLIVAAVARAIADQPAVNRVWQDDEILQFQTIDVGLAVDTEAGLMVPVLRDLATADLHGLAGQAAALVARAREGRLTAADVGGGAVTVSNAGMHDVTYMTSIITPGQSSILGVGSVREVFRPDARARPKLAREMGLVLSADHRILDGVSGLAFLNRIKAYIENPLNLLLPAAS